VPNEIVILGGAEADLCEAYAIFDSRNRGNEFYRASESALEQIRQFPMSGPVVYNQFRRKLIRRFPYGLFYRPIGQRVVVSAALDLRQNPENIFRRLK